MAKILVVEDESIIALDIQQRLKRLGYAVPEVAHSGAEAIQMAAQVMPDLVLMDIRLEGEMDGIETASIISKQRHVPIVFLTAYSDGPTFERAKLTNPFGYVLKPFKDRELHNTIEIVLYRHRAEEQLRRLSQTVEQSRDAIVIIDAEGSIEHVNPAFTRMTGWTREAVVGKNVRHLDQGEQLHEFCAALLQTIADQKERSGEFQHRDENGEQRWEESTITSIRDEEGEITSYLAIRRDITERKQLERELVGLERLRALEEMAGGISHNLNNILTGVLLPAQVLQSSLRDREQLEDVERIISAAEHARDLVRRLERSVRARELEQEEPVHLDAAVDAALEAARPHWLDPARERGAAVEVAVDLKNIPPVRSASKSLCDIVLILLANAVEAMPAGGTVELRARAEGDGVLLSVRDTGIGMDEEIRRRLFEPFFTTKATVDAGLGLSLARGMVSRWGGRIAAESRPGEGATFAVWLPAWRDQPSKG